MTKRHLDKLVERGADLAVEYKPLDELDRDAAIELGCSTAPVVCADLPTGPQTWDGYRPDRLDALKAAS
jgi:glutaredoxin-like protein NrdH